MSDYQYPIDETWTKEEIIDVINFFNLIESVYESSVDRKDLIEAYRKFKKVVPSKSEEKNYFADFEKNSSYSSYHVVKEIRNSKEKTVSFKR